MNYKPKCPLIGANGNIFNLMAVATNTLKQYDMREQADEMKSRVMSSSSYGMALGILCEYVEPVSVGESLNDNEDECMNMGVS